MAGGFGFAWRRERDSKPEPLAGLAVFKTVPDVLGHARKWSHRTHRTRVQRVRPLATGRGHAVRCQLVANCGWLDFPTRAAPSSRSPEHPEFLFSPGRFMRVPFLLRAQPEDNPADGDERHHERTQGEQCEDRDPCQWRERRDECPTRRRPVRATQRPA